MSPLEVVWTGLAIFGLATVFINLADAWADNVTLQDDTRDGLADLQAAGNIIALDNIGREVLVFIGLLSCLALGIMALMAPNPPPATPERQRVVVIFQMCLIVIEVCLVLISILGRVRRINVHRMLQMAIRARADAAAAGERSELATAVATQAAAAPAPPTPDQQAMSDAADAERAQHREDHRLDREERAERAAQPKPYDVPPPGTIPQAGEPEKTNQ